LFIPQFAMPYNPEHRETLGQEGIVQSYIAAKNLPEDVTVEQLTLLFDSAGVVANIKLFPVREGSRTAIVVYYSDETARRALEDLDGNMSLGLSSPLELEYFGPSDMRAVELELERRSLMLNGLVDGIASSSLM